MKVDDRRPKRWGWAPGDYYNTCTKCEGAFIGDRRASMCADCAYSMPDILTPARGEPMPRTIEYYIARGERDQELILEMKEEISKLRQKLNSERQKNKNTNS